VKLLLAQERDRALAAEAQAQKAESTRARHEEAARRAAVRARDAEARSTATPHMPTLFEDVQRG